MKQALQLILILSIIAVGTDFFAPYRASPLELLILDSSGNERAVEYGADGWLRLDSGAEVLRLRLRTAGVQSGGNLEFDFAGGVLFAAHSGRDQPGAIGAPFPACAPTAGERLHCRYAFHLSEHESIDFGTATGEPRLTALKINVVKTSVTSQANLASLAYLYGGLAVIGVLFLLVTINASAKGWILIATGAAWLILAGGTSGAVALAIVLAVGITLWHIMRAGPSAKRVVAVAAAICAVFVAANVLSNGSAGVFANPHSLPLPVPLGLAFFTIRALELTFRVGTRELRDISARDYLLFMLFPATLAAGPIFSYPDFKRGAIAQPSIVDWAAGLSRIGVGVFKKFTCDILLVRFLAPKLLALYSDPGGDHLALWLLLVPYALYVYLDFSAYSDIAIGTGRLLGWRVPENFNWPFLRSNLRAFWTSWHMTLSLWVSRWVHFFLAFPMRRAHRAAQLTLPVIGSLLVIGIWHEMQVTWFLWGLHHATGIILSDVLVGVAAAIVLPGVWGKLVTGLKRAIGMLGVLLWVSLSHCFTLVSDPAMAMALWAHALGLH